jgi:hypothetical protein
MKTLFTALVALAAAALLAACGGGGGADDGGAPAAMDDTVPASATASPEALAQYVAALPQDDRREPLNVAGLVLPTSETAEPVPVAR